MSDYGFKTLKNGKSNTTDVAINAKFPIMGFDLSHRPSAYVTFHITDAKDNPLADSSTPGYVAPELPSVSSLTGLGIGVYDPQGNVRQIKGGSNKTSGYVKTLIYQYEHGYNFRPACYGTITGKISQKTRTNAIGNGSGTSPAGKYYFNGSLSDSNWNLMSSFNTTTEGAGMSAGDSQLFPYMNGMKTIFGNSLNTHMFHYMMTTSDVPSTSSNTSLIKPAMNRLTSLFYNNTITGGEYPYSFTVDDKYVKIYRTYYWSEIYGRIYFDETMYDTDYNYRYELKDFLKVRQVEELAGSEIDINIMMFPYKMEDIK